MKRSPTEPDWRGSIGQLNVIPAIGWTVVPIPVVIVPAIIETLTESAPAYSVWLLPSVAPGITGPATGAAEADGVCGMA